MSFFSAIFAPGEQERSDELDARRVELERTRAARGLITDEQAAANIANINSQRLDVGAEVDQAFKEGAQEGYDATVGAVKTTLAAPFKFGWDIIPWQLLVVAGLALFFWAGGLEWLKGRLK